MPTTRQTFPIEFKGGLITNMSPLQQGINAPGSARILKNFEPSIEGGYRRIQGYTKYNSSIIPPYGAPVVNGASQFGGTLNIANIRTTPVVGDTFKLIHATAQVNNTVTAAVNGAITSTTALVLDTNVGTIVVGMTVTGDGISGTVTVASITDQQNITLSSAQTLADNVVLTFDDSDNTTHIVDTVFGTIKAGMDVSGTGIPTGVTVSSISGSTITLSTGLDLAEDLELTFSDIYTISSGGVSYNATERTAALTFTPTIDKDNSPANGDAVEFTSTASNYLMLGCGVFLDRVIVAKNDDLFKVSSSDITQINVPSYGTVLVNGASQTGSSLVVDGLTSAPQQHDIFKIAAAGPTAQVNGPITSSTALVVDNNNGTIVQGMIVTGDGISGTVTVVTVTDQNNLVLSSAQTLEDNKVLTFSSTVDKIYRVTADATVSSGSSTLSINPALDTSTAKVNGAITSSTALVVDNNNGDILVGMTVTGTGISGTVTVVAVTNEQNIVLSSAQTLSDDVDLTFTNFPADNAAITFLSTSRESAGKTRFARYNYTGTEKIAIVDGTNVPALYDNTTFTALNDAPTDVNGASFVVNFKNQLFFGKSNLLSFTAPYTDNDFTSANGSGTISLGGTITGLIVFRQQLIIFTETSILQLVGNTIADFNLQPITLDIGCVDTDTIQEVGGDVMFLGPDGLRLLSGTDRIGDFGLGNVSKAIQKEVTNFISTNTSFASVVIRNKSQYRILGYNTNIKQENAQGILGTQFAGQGGEGMAWAETRGIRVYVADSRFYQNTETIVFGNDDGYLYQMEDGNNFDGANIQTTFATPYMPINDPRVRKTFYKAYLYTDPQGSVSFDMSLKLDFDQKDSIQPTEIDFANSTGQVAFYGQASYGSTEVYSTKLLTLFETQLIGSGFTGSIQFESDSTDPPFSLDAITIEFGTNTRR